MVHVGDRNIDMGNYFTDENGARCLITSRELAEKYGQLVSCPVYVRRPTKRTPDALRCTSDNGEHYYLTYEKCVFCQHESG